VRDTEGPSYTLASRFFWSDYLTAPGVDGPAPKNLPAPAHAREEIDRYCKDGITEEEVPSSGASSAATIAPSGPTPGSPRSPTRSSSIRPLLPR
jgi:hypothetical protein